MTIKSQIITIRRPDDWHVHFRDNEILKTVVPYTSKIFHRAVVMPNLIPPITTVNSAVSYRQRILNAVPKEHNFLPLMTYYLTDLYKIDEIDRGFKERIFFAAKLYLINSTTNSNYGVSNINNIMPVLEHMEKLGMPLLVHGEVTHSEIDIFDREAHFIETIMDPLRQKFQELKIVFEHISTKDAAEYVNDSNHFLAATITPQHLMFNRNHMLVGGIRPHLYCLPILKRKIHQKALQKLISSGFERVFLGTDSAPHSKYYKESHCGHAGCFNASVALSSYASVFEEMNAFKYFEAFCSLNGPRFYGLEPNKENIKLYKKKIISKPIKLLDNIDSDTIVPFLETKSVNWIIKL